MRHKDELLGSLTTCRPIWEQLDETKNQGQPKLDEAVARVQFGERNFMNPVCKLDEHADLFTYNYVA